MSDTDQQPRAARPSNGGLSISGTVTMSRKTLLGIVVLLGGVGGVGAYTGVRADGRVDEVKAEAVEAKGAAAAAKAEAKADVAELGKDVKEKLDPTAGVAVQAAAVATRSASECATKAEVEELRRAIEGLPLSGRRRWRGRRDRERVRIVVPPEVKEPLPVPPAPATEGAK